MPLPRIIFMGTPAFAVASLNALVQAGCPVVGVVTAPDRPAGRGQQLRMSAVKERALELGLPVLQPEKLKDPAFHAELDRLNADLYVVVAFRMLPEAVWDRPAMGTMNLHASLLPSYRGAAPINWAVINGEQRTGATTFLLKHDIDTGDMLLQQELSIGPEETAGELHDRIMAMGAELLVRTVHGIADGSLQRTPQPSDVANLPHAPKLVPANTRIDPTGTVQRVHDHIRGLSPFPGAWAMWNEADRPARHFKVGNARPYDNKVQDVPGTVRVVGDQLLLQCADGRLALTEVQQEGRKRMSAQEFVRGMQQHGPVTLG